LGDLVIRGETTRGQFSELKTGDTIRVKHDGKLVEIFVNDKKRCGPVGVQGLVRPLVINGDRKLAVRLSGGQMQTVKKQTVLLSMDHATESPPFQTILDLTPWEARVVGSLCVMSYKLTFVARCYKEEVRVKIVLSGKNGDEHAFLGSSY
jgi:hypothetical protein